MIIFLALLFFTLHSLLHSLTQIAKHTIRKHGYTSIQKSPYLMTGFNLLQNFVVTNLLHVMKLLDLNRTQNTKTI